eukprot:TRINITY_DN1899_c0_g1_i1.p1 TRINITY_DN1899_c0_g1~~TRINITY_DN1899_c0_g1_i1.p1  ORF type:complete len:839 (+),score=146.83 TRINITY_DN1899_c0_g1_i1:147-2663(+)
MQHVQHYHPSFTQPQRPLERSGMTPPSTGAMHRQQQGGVAMAGGYHHAGLSHRQGYQPSHSEQRPTSLSSGLLRGTQNSGQNAASAPGLTSQRVKNHSHGPILRNSQPALQQASASSMPGAAGAKEAMTPPIIASASQMPQRGSLGSGLQAAAAAAAAGKVEGRSNGEDGTASKEVSSSRTMAPRRLSANSSPTRPPALNYSRQDRGRMHRSPHGVQSRSPEGRPLDPQAQAPQGQMSSRMLSPEARAEAEGGGARGRSVAAHRGGGPSLDDEGKKDLRKEIDGLCGQIFEIICLMIDNLPAECIFNHPLPRLDPNGEVYVDRDDRDKVHWMLEVLQRGSFSVMTFLMTPIYLERVKNETKGGQCKYMAREVVVHAQNWRLLFMLALLEADKMWEERAIKNIDVMTVFNDLQGLYGAKLQLDEINEAETNFLRCLSVHLSLDAKPSKWRPHWDKHIERLDRGMTVARKRDLALHEEQVRDSRWYKENKRVYDDLIAREEAEKREAAARAEYAKAVMVQPARPGALSPVRVHARPFVAVSPGAAERQQPLQESAPEPAPRSPTRAHQAPGYPVVAEQSLAAAAMEKQLTQPTTSFRPMMDQSRARSSGVSGAARDPLPVSATREGGTRPVQANLPGARQPATRATIAVVPHRHPTAASVGAASKAGHPPPVSLAGSRSATTTMADNGGGASSSSTQQRAPGSTSMHRAGSDPQSTTKLRSTPRELAQAQPAERGREGRPTTRADVQHPGGSTSLSATANRAAQQGGVRPLGSTGGVNGGSLPQTSRDYNLSSSQFSGVAQISGRQHVPMRQQFSSSTMLQPGQAATARTQPTTARYAGR